MKRITTYLMIAIAAMSLASCVTSNEMASEYLDKFPGDKNFPQVKIYVCLPTAVVHTNQTLNQIDNFLYLSPSVQDSIIIANTKFLNQIDDKVFLQQFSDNLLYHLRRTGAQVEAVADRNAMPQAGENCFVLNIPQIEAEEFIKKSRSEFVETNGTYYHYDYDLHGFSTNVWYLFGNDTNAVYYKNFEIMDNFKGQVEEVKNKKASVTGKFRRININDVYADAGEAGKKTAVLYVEKIIDDYLANKGRNDQYYIYNPVSNSLGTDALSVRAGKQRTFQKIENK
ncbi:MAG: hypothetical protein IK032_04215 [Bacteroidales bacterium]|nr:hypothetical protein [Bacteroidales bacterium]